METTGTAAAATGAAKKPRSRSRSSAANRNRNRTRPTAAGANTATAAAANGGFGGGAAGEFANRANDYHVLDRIVTEYLAANKNVTLGEIVIYDLMSWCSSGLKPHGRAQTAGSR